MNQALMNQAFSKFGMRAFNLFSATTRGIGNLVNMEKIRRSQVKNKWMKY